MKKLIPVILALFAAATAQAMTLELKSPDGKLVVQVETGAGVYYTLSHGGDRTHDIGEVLLQGFGVVLEVARRFTVELLYGAHTQLSQQFGQHDTTYRVHTIDSHLEISLADSLHVYEVKCKHAIYMLLVIRVVLCIVTHVVDVGKLECLGSSNRENFISLGSIEELALLIEELEGIPLLGVMACGKDDTTT